MSTQLDLALDPPDLPKRPKTAVLRSHHVRSHQTADEALEGEERAGRQDTRVLSVFRPGARLTPSQVHGLLCDECGPRAPLKTSIRRSLTNLTRRGLLVHHKADRRPGPHGARESTWGLK